MHHLTFHPLEGTWYDENEIPTPCSNTLAKKLGKEDYKRAMRLNDAICAVLFCALALLCAAGKFL